MMKESDVYQGKSVWEMWQFLVQLRRTATSCAVGKSNAYTVHLIVQGIKIDPFSMRVAMASTYVCIRNNIQNRLIVESSCTYIEVIKVVKIPVCHVQVHTSVYTKVQKYH